MTEYVVSGGQTGSGIALNSGDMLTVLSGGTVSLTAISGVFDDPAFEFVSSGGLDLGATVEASGEQIVEAGGTASGAVIDAYGFQDVFGNATSTTASGGALVYVESGGTVFGTSLGAGSIPGVNNFGSALMLVFSGGTAGGTVVNGGDEVVDAGAVDNGASLTGNFNLLTGGFQGVQDVFGSATGAVVSAAGLQIVERGGRASGTILSGTGVQIVSSGGIAIATTVVDGGGLEVNSGGIIVRPVIDGAGAVLGLSPGEIVSGGITFAGVGGVLETLQLSLTFTISGFAPGDAIDLSEFAFSGSGTATLGSGNVLHIAENGATFDLNLDPSQNFAGDFFALAPDPGTGTDITETPLAPPGGQFTFLNAPGTRAISIGISNNFNNYSQFAPVPIAGKFNIEVSTEFYDGPFPPLDSGFQAAVIDNAGFIDSSGYLTGTQLHLFTGDYAVFDVAGAGNTPAEIFLGSGNQTVGGAPGDTIVGGSGPATVFGAAGDSIAFGSVGQYADGTAGDMTIAVGAGGVDSIVGSTVAGGGDTITGGAASVGIEYLGPGDVVDFTEQTGAARINATAGSSTILLGGGAASVFGGGGDTVTFGSVGQYADGTAGDMTIAVGTAGTDLVVGSGVAGSGDTILGGAANLDYNPQFNGGSDLLDLSGSTGSATINAFSAFPSGQFAHVDDTIVAGNGSYSVWGGGGDRIGVGDGPTVGGTDLWSHSTTVPGAAVGFGTNDTVVATTYDTVGDTFSVNSTLPGASSAQVTVGGGAGNFDTAHDFLFYPNESPATDAAIVATAQSANGGASSVIALPDGTLMTLTGVTLPQLAAAFGGGTLFQA